MMSLPFWCRSPVTVIVMRANGGHLGAKEAAQQVSAANRTNLIKMIIAFRLMGGGIGAFSATFAGKKNATT